MECSKSSRDWREISNRTISWLNVTFCILMIAAVPVRGVPQSVHPVFEPVPPQAYARRLPLANPLPALRSAVQHRDVACQTPPLLRHGGQLSGRECINERFEQSLSLVGSLHQQQQPLERQCKQQQHGSASFAAGHSVISAHFVCIAQHDEPAATVQTAVARLDA